MTIEISTSMRSSSGGMGYCNCFQHHDRTRDGIHSEWSEIFNDIGCDPDNNVVILTGPGKAFCEGFDASGFSMETAVDWDKIFFEGKRFLMDIEVPMIAAVNGPARIHADIPVLCDTCWRVKMRSSRICSISSMAPLPEMSCIWSGRCCWDSIADGTSYSPDKNCRHRKRFR
jgi:hypothetical protein